MFSDLPPSLENSWRRSQRISEEPRWRRGRAPGRGKLGRVGWLSMIVAGAAGLAAMRAAIDRGDVEEAARQGALAGPAAIEQALAAPDRAARIAAIAAAPSAGELPAARAELLPALARAASRPDRRTAIPAARAAREIARSLLGHARPPGAAAELPDDLAPDDVAAWRAAWARLAARAELWIELRVLALDTAAALDPGGVGVELGAALADPDPAYRRAAIALVPMPVPAAMRAALAREERVVPLARDAAALHELLEEVSAGALVIP